MWHRNCGDCCFWGRGGWGPLFATHIEKCVSLYMQPNKLNAEHWEKLLHCNCNCNCIWTVATVSSDRRDASRCSRQHFRLAGSPAPTLTSLDCFYVTECLCCCCRSSGSFCVPWCSCDWYPLAFTIHYYSLFSYSEHASKFVSFSALGGTIVGQLLWSYLPLSVFFFFGPVYFAFSCQSEQKTGLDVTQNNKLGNHRNRIIKL